MVFVAAKVFFEAVQIRNQNESLNIGIRFPYYTSIIIYILMLSANKLRKHNYKLTKFEKKIGWEIW